MRANGPSSFFLPPRPAVVALALAGLFLAARHWGSETPATPVTAPPGSPRWSSTLTGELGRAAGDLLRRYVEGFLSEHEADADSDGDLQLIQRFLDPTTPRQQRRLDAWRLAARGDDEARAVLSQALRYGTPAQRAAAAEAYGRGKFDDALGILGELLADADPAVAKGALSGLAALGTEGAVRLLEQVLADPSADPEIRARSAALLGEMGGPAALRALKSAATLPLDEDSLAAVIDGLGGYRFRDTAEVFRGLLADPSRDTRFKAEATEALARSDEAALPFLLETAASAADPEVRAAAAWAAGAHAHTGRIGPELGRMLLQEPDGEVRRRLYESLMVQGNPGGAAVMERAFGETEPAARIAGANAVAMAIRRDQADAAVIARFHGEYLPDLVTTALGDRERNLRYRAVFALIRAGTGEAASALGSIAAHGDREIAALAARGLALYPHFPDSNR